MKINKFCIFSITFILMLFFMKYWHIGLSYQNTESMPEGFYFTYYSNSIKKNDTIIFNPKLSIANMIIKRYGAKGFKPKDIFLLKKVVGIPKDFLCIKKNNVWINNKKIAFIKKYDSKGRKLPRFNFCGIIPKNLFFVQGTSSPNSFDSRYFGFIKKTQIFSKAIKL